MFTHLRKKCLFLSEDQKLCFRALQPAVEIDIFFLTLAEESLVSEFLPVVKFILFIALQCLTPCGR